MIIVRLLSPEPVGWLTHHQLYSGLGADIVMESISVRRDSAVKLVDDLTGESPVSADYPVGTVVIFGDGTGDQAVGSPDVNALDGRTQVWSAPTGGLAKQQVVAKANRSQASKTHTPPESECEVRRE